MSHILQILKAKPVDEHPAAESVVDKDVVDKESPAVMTQTAGTNDVEPGSKGEDPISRDAQAGVQNMEAIASVWTTSSLILAYVLVWISYFVILMQQNTLITLVPFVTSAFASHSLTPTVTVISSIATGVSNLTTAKLLDVFGRHQGFLISLILNTLGLIMMAACTSVEQYAAAEVFYTVGQSSLMFTLTTFVADTSSLRNRGLMIAFTTSPNMITLWISGPFTQAFLEGPGWPWGVGVFCIIVPVVCLPFYGILLYNFRKAKKQGLVSSEDTGRTVWQHILYYAREFDAIGLLLITVGLAMFLLPFNIYTLQEKGWESPLIICLLVFGIVLLVAFVCWERWLAPVTFLPYYLLLNRTLVGACTVGVTLFLNYSIWASFFTSFLMVVCEFDVTKASYVFNTYSFGGGLFSLFMGWLIRKTGDFKKTTLFIGIPLACLATGLMIHFRQPGVNVGYIVMCQLFMAISFGIIMIADYVSIWAAAPHQYVAVLLAVVGMASSIGGAVGLTVSAAIWQNVFPNALAKYLPVEELENLATIYGDINTQLMYPVGSEARLAIQHAYGDTQKMLLISGTAVWVIGLVGALLWRDIDVRDIKQVKGHVI